MELTKASDFSAPNRFWTDPKTVPPAPPPQPDITVMAAEQENTKRTITAKQLDVEQKERDSVRDFELKKFEIETNAINSREVERMRLDHAHSLEDRKAVNQAGLKQIEGQQAEKIEDKRLTHKTDTNKISAQVDELQQTVAEGREVLSDMQQAIKTLITAKRQIRRGKDGKAEGVDIVGPDGAVIASQKVQRGPDGKVLGAG
jgi:Mg2+ and Co2+ transporter CorA